MALAKRHDTPFTMTVPRRRLLEEGPLVIEYSISPIAPSMWVAHAAVLRGVPGGLGRDLHPQFTGNGVTENDALQALLRELEQYLNDPFWEGLPCH